MKRNIFLGVVITIVVALIITAIISIDSPQVSRLKKMDRNTINDLSVAYDGISLYWSNSSSTLPESLEEVQRKGFQYSQKDLTGISYTVQEETEGTFELCANFQYSTLDEEFPQESYYEYSRFAQHDSGRYCFDLQVVEFEKPTYIR